MTNRILLVALLLAVVVAGTLAIEGQLQKALDVKVPAEIVYRGFSQAEMQLLYVGYEEDTPAYPAEIATSR